MNHEITGQPLLAQARAPLTHRLIGAGLALSLLVTFAVRGLAVTIAVQGSNAVVGDTPDVCVTMPDNDGTLSGIQMDLVWDRDCLTVDSQGNEGACVVNPQTNRTTFRTRIGADGLRVIMLNISDTAPISPAVEQLFCCQFRVSGSAAERTCAIALANVIASDPVGTRIPVTTRPGIVTVQGATESPGSANPPGGESSGGGCQLSPSGPAALWPLFVGASLLWLRRKRCTRA